MYTVSLTKKGIIYGFTSLAFDCEMAISPSVYFWLHAKFNDIEDALKYARDKFLNALNNPHLYKKQKYLELIDIQDLELWQGDGKLVSYNEAERILTLKALESSAFVQKKAAKLLGVTPRQFNYMVQKHRINHDNWRRKND